MKVSPELKAACLLLLLLAILKPISKDLAFLAAFFYQLYVPGRLGYLATEGQGRGEFARVLWVSVVTLVPFALVYHQLQSYWAVQAGYSLHFEAAFSGGLLWSFGVNLILIAWPEEFFYRGFLQNRLSIVSVNSLFALGHFVGEYDPVRLLPFFPGLVFSWLVYRSGSLAGAVFYHALCNTFSEWLAASYSWSR